MEEVQTKRELNQAYAELGKSVVELVEAGEITDPRLGAIVEKIRTLRAKLEAEGVPADEVDESRAPAMPT